MTEEELLNNVTKRTSRNANTRKYGMFGLALGEDTYNRLEAYCKKHNIYKSNLVKSLVVDYLDRAERGENV